MSRSETFRNISQGFFYWIAVVAIILFIIWIVISVVGNVVLNNQARLSEAPTKEEAPFAFVIYTTGRVVYAESYVDDVRDKYHIYTLNGYYEKENNKFIYDKGTISLDEYYYGNIEVIRRDQ